MREINTGPTYQRAVAASQRGVMRVFGMDTKDESKTLEIRQTRGDDFFTNPDNQIVASWW